MSEQILNQLAALGVETHQISRQGETWIQFSLAELINAEDAAWQKTHTVRCRGEYPSDGHLLCTGCGRVRNDPIHTGHLLPAAPAGKEGKL